MPAAAQCGPGRGPRFALYGRMRPVQIVTLSAVLIAIASGTVPAATDGEVASVAAVREPSPLIAHPHAIGVDIGFASAVGAAGITFTQAFGQTFRIEAGVGRGFSGTQVSLMPKIVLGGARDHFVTGIGIAYTISPDTRFTDGNPVWLNIDALGYEHLFASGFAFSFAVGIDRGLGGGRFCVVECDASPFDKQDVRTLAGPQARMGIAYWF